MIGERNLNLVADFDAERLGRARRHADVEARALVRAEIYCAHDR
jgi:hypothetical protein